MTSYISLSVLILIYSLFQTLDICVCKLGYGGTGCHDDFGGDFACLFWYQFNIDIPICIFLLFQTLGKCVCSPGYSGVGCRDHVGGNAGVYWPV